MLMVLVIITSSLVISTSPVDRVTEAAVVAALKHTDYPPAKNDHTSMSMMMLYVCVPLVVLAFILCAVVVIYLRSRRQRKIHHAVPSHQNAAFDNAVYSLPPPIRFDSRVAPPTGQSDVCDTTSLPPPYEENPYDEIPAFWGEKGGVQDESKHSICRHGGIFHHVG